MGRSLVYLVQRDSTGSIVSLLARDGSRNFAPGQPAVLVDSAIWSMFAISTMFIALRFYCRLHRSGRPMRDDLVLGTGWACMLASTSLLTSAMGMGYIDMVLGENTVIPLAQCAHTCHMVSLTLTKTLFAVTLIPITRAWQRHLIWFVIGSINIVFAVHIILLWRPFCEGETPYDLHVSCWDASHAVKLNITSSLYSSLADFVLALLPWKVLMDLQMRKPERISLAIGMSFGVVAGVTGIMKAVQSVSTLDSRVPDFKYNLVIFWIFTLAEPNATIVAACVPVIRVLFKDARKRYYASESPSAGRYVRPSNHDFGAFAGRASRRNDGPDSQSEQGILDGGITRTRGFAVDFEEDRSFEMRDHSSVKI
ncbi:hypothetical protein PG993_006196 [Apiospora rasikravindrae]|uniref:Rhodopsin domain-containing protein n=1 Tax=Apiospora rasikravindrae TaxID=990691 RepID=A0ABR1T7H6_9PEZI